jgi:uncharacterized protein (DUF2336 family)
MSGAHDPRPPPDGVAGHAPVGGDPAPDGTAGAAPTGAAAAGSAQPGSAQPASAQSGSALTGSAPSGAVPTASGATSSGATGPRATASGGTAPGATGSGATGSTTADAAPAGVAAHGPAPSARDRRQAAREVLSDPDVLANLVVAMADAPPEPDEESQDSQDDRIRTLLARRIATLLPTLNEAAQQQLRRHVLTMLFKLVEDECTRVRAAIADVVKDMPGAPHELILRLAHDTDISVCEPVIRLSPLLTQDDLMALLRAHPSPDTATAIARRPGLTEALSDAIFESAGNAAIRTLLANESAAIREATLNAMIARAAAQTDWQEPLVRRPRLSAAAAAALSNIVTTRLLEYLASRQDLDPAVTDQLRIRLAERTPAQARAPRTGEMTSSQALLAASRLHSQGMLHEIDLQEALQRGEARYASAIVAVAAGVPLAVVERAAALRSAKGLVSLVWKAGFSMHAAAALQVLLARLPPGAVLTAAKDGGFPLMVSEMRWHLAFLNRLARSGVE